MGQGHCGHREVGRDDAGCGGPDAGDVSANPAAFLGLVIGAAAAGAGRDKLTLVVPARLEPVGIVD